MEDFPDMGPSPFQSMGRISIDQKRVSKLLSNLQPHKASGPDEIPTYLLQAAAEDLDPFLPSLFQVSLDQGTVPQDWKEALIFPIYKKGERYLAANYRPVSLTSDNCKILEHIVHSSVLTNSVFCVITSMGSTRNSHVKLNLPSLFTRSPSTYHAAARSPKSSSTPRKHSIMCPRLLHKLDFYSIRGHLKMWIGSFLRSRKQRVVLDGCKSTEAEVFSGVPQGTVLGPLLLLAFINDLSDWAKHSDTRLFADGSFLFRQIKGQKDSELLQQDLTALEEWEKTWQMSFQASKSTLIRIPPQHKKLLQTNY